MADAAVAEVGVVLAGTVSAMLPVEVSPMMDVMALLSATLSPGLIGLEPSRCSNSDIDDDGMTVDMDTMLLLLSLDLLATIPSRSNVAPLSRCGVDTFITISLRAFTDDIADDDNDNMDVVVEVLAVLKSAGDGVIVGLAPSNVDKSAATCETYVGSGSGMSCCYRFAFCDDVGDDDAGRVD